MRISSPSFPRGGVSCIRDSVGPGGFGVRVLGCLPVCRAGRVLLGAIGRTSAYRPAWVLPTSRILGPAAACWGRPVEQSAIGPCSSRSFRLLVRRVRQVGVEDGGCRQRQEVLRGSGWWTWGSGGPRRAGGVLV